VISTNPSTVVARLRWIMVEASTITPRPAANAAPLETVAIGSIAQGYTVSSPCFQARRHSGKRTGVAGGD
jgi:hypothetical protein